MAHVFVTFIPNALATEFVSFTNDFTVWGASIDGASYGSCTKVLVTGYEDDDMETIDEYVGRFLKLAGASK